MGIWHKQKSRKNIVGRQSIAKIIEITLAQGKPFTKEQREEIIQSLKPFLEAGFSRNKACEAISLPAQTLSNWVQQDEALGMKLQGWENTMNMLALANVHSALQLEAEQEDTKKETSKWYLERRMKEAFSTRQENTGADGEPLSITFDNVFNKKAE